MNWQTKQAKQNLSKLTPVQRWTEFERLLTEGAKAKGWSVSIQRIFGAKASSCWFYGEDFTAGCAVEVSDSLVLCAPDPSPLVNATLRKVALSMAPEVVAAPPPPPVIEFVPPPGAHPVGSISFAHNGEMWMCTAPGLPGTWKKLAMAPKAFMVPLVTPSYVEFVFDGVNWKTTKSDAHPTVSALAEIVPTISTAKARCPQCLKGPVLSAVKEMPLAHAIVHLNDHHRWTREQIADWLDLLDVDLSIRQKEVA